MDQMSPFHTMLKNNFGLSDTKSIFLVVCGETNRAKVSMMLLKGA